MGTKSINQQLRGALVGKEPIDTRLERAVALDAYLAEIEAMLHSGDVASASERVAQMRKFISWITQPPT